ncbi:hypothetical protein AB205_0201030, partial [Aquarana catesbeiana]
GAKTRRTPLRGHQEPNTSERRGTAGKIVTTTGDVLVVEEQAQHFTSASAQILIQEIMVWNH